MKSSVHTIRLEVISCSPVLINELARANLASNNRLKQNRLLSFPDPETSGKDLNFSIQDSISSSFVATQDEKQRAYN